jgi:hypothetical protein
MLSNNQERTFTLRHLKKDQFLHIREQLWGTQYAGLYNEWGSLDVCRAGSEGLKDQPRRCCTEWLLDSHGTREMQSDGNIPLGQEPWELSVRNWLA